MSRTRSPPAQAVASLEETGAVLLIEADEASRAAFGPNPLLMSSRAGSAAAGYAQGSALADGVARFWG